MVQESNAAHRKSKKNKKKREMKIKSPLQDKAPQGSQFSVIAAFLCS